MFSKIESIELAQKIGKPNVPNAVELLVNRVHTLLLRLRQSPLQISESKIK